MGDKYATDNVEFLGKAYGGKTLKQELSELMARDIVIPASKLAAVKEEDLQRIRDFEAAAIDEERSRKHKAPGKPNDIQPGYTREPFIE